MNRKQIVVENDKLILDLATYAATKGNTLIARTQEEILKQMERVQNRFVEYKHLLKTGESTYEQLEKDILDKYGITAPLIKKEKMPDDIKALINQLKGEYNNKVDKKINKIIGFGNPE